VPEQTPRGHVLTNISNAIVGLHKEYYGKGPTKTKTHVVDDTVICVLRGGFTPVEKTLIDSGRASAVREIRHAFQQAMRTRFVDVIETTLERKVIAYLSQVHTEPEVSVEVFLLESAGGEGGTPPLAENGETYEDESGATTP
jgi:uncharacterized protein YbcI